MLLSRNSSYQNIDDGKLEIQNYTILNFNEFILSKTRQNPLKHALNFVSFNYNRLKRLKRSNYSPLNRSIFVKRFYTRICASPLSYRLKNVLKIELLNILNSGKAKMCKELKNVGSLNTNQTSEGNLSQSQNVLVENKSGQRTADLSAQDSVSTRSAVLIIASIFIFSILALTYIYFKFPDLEPEERKYIKLPWDVEEAKQLGQVLEKHKERNYYEVLAAIIVTYIFLQTFAIPGSISLSILSGFLFPFPLALGLVCFCSATGASFCYLLSHLAGRRLVHKYFPDRAVQYSLTVQKHRKNIFNYILFLRITPFLPNWFINIAAPIVNVPIMPFWLGTFLGVAPPSFVAIQAGQTLQQLTSMSGSWSWTSVSLLAVFSIVSLVPVLLRERLRTKFD